MQGIFSVIARLLCREPPNAFVFDFGRIPFSDCTDALKSSLAAALRHSREQAQRTYDRRTANERKQLAVNLAREYAERELDGSDSNGNGGPSQPSPAGCPFKAGKFVGVVEEASTLSQPKILIGQVQSLLASGDVSLLWYKNISGNLYKLQLTGELWSERVGSLVAVSVRAAKNRPGVYRLLTSPRTIHKAVLAD